MSAKLASVTSPHEPAAGCHLKGIRIWVGTQSLPAPYPHLKPYLQVIESLNADYFSMMQLEAEERQALSSREEGAQCFPTRVVAPKFAVADDGCPAPGPSVPSHLAVCTDTVLF